MSIWTGNLLSIVFGKDYLRTHKMTCKGEGDKEPMSSENLKKIICKFLLSNVMISELNFYFVLQITLSRNGPTIVHPHRPEKFVVL